MKQKQISILVVTYGDRRNFLRQSLPKLVTNLKEVLYKIIIVQNGICYDMHKFILSIKIADFCVIIQNKSNEGSAGGFGKGIEYLKSISNVEWALILDDDSLLTADVANKLQNLNFDGISEMYGKFGFSLYRPDHDQDNDKFKRNWDYTEKYYKNSISRFSFLHYFKLKSSKKIRTCSSTAELYMAPYSGLFLKISDIRNIRPINKEYYLYDDDLCFTAQLSNNGVKILQCKDLYLKDLEQSWYQDTDNIVQKKNIIQLLLETKSLNSKIRPYYQIRNGIYTSRTVFKENSLIYYVNLFLFTVVPLFRYVPHNIKGFRNYLFFLKTVSEGHRGILGKKNFK